MAKKTPTVEAQAVPPATDAKPAPPPRRPSPLVDSHYVKVMLDQVFGENNFQNALASIAQMR